MSTSLGAKHNCTVPTTFCAEYVLRRLRKTERPRLARPFSTQHAAISSHIALELAVWLMHRYYARGHSNRADQPVGPHPAIGTGCWSNVLTVLARSRTAHSQTPPIYLLDFSHFSSAPTILQLTQILDKFTENIMKYIKQFSSNFK